MSQYREGDPFSAGKSMKHSYLGLALVFSGVVSSAHADPRLASEKNCMVCHGVTSRQLGPSFREVATRYAGQKDAADKLTHKVLVGGVGAWGNAAMPANRQLSEAEARKLVLWILAQK
jgi:cytochrome c